MDRSGTLLLSLILLLTVAVFGATAWLFFVDKQYDFYVEAACDPSTETCFYRDCSDEEVYCPPNGLQEYKVFYVSAHDFETCADNSCKNECESGSIPCEELMCGEAEEDECAIYEPPLEEVIVEEVDEGAEEEEATP